MTPRRPVLRYHGGKWRLAPWICAHFPRHRTYVEPYGGGGSVLLRKPRAHSEIYNDCWGLVVNVFRVLRDPETAEQLRRAVELTPFARDEFAGCGHADMAAIADPIERARRTIFRSFAGHGSASVNGDYSTGLRVAGRRSGGAPCREWATYPAEIPAFVERLRGVTIENRDALELLARHDAEDMLAYLDPPYPHTTRNMRRGNANYVFEMTDDDHREFAAVARGLSGHVVVSGYRCELYEKLFAGWPSVERVAQSDGGERTEVLWLHPRTWDALGRRPQAERKPIQQLALGVACG